MSLNYERIAGRFQQRIAEITIRYEGDLAILADELDEVKHERDHLKEELAALKGNKEEGKD